MADDRSFDGWSASTLERLLDLPKVELRGRVTSTLDVAHELAATGAPAGTLVLAETQTAGRGRSGAHWTSASGAGIWLTMIERPNDVAALEVLSLRLGMRVAAVLDRFADSVVRLKWPNDLYIDGGKLAGILIETRWRGGRPDWTAVGLGINIRPPAGLPAAALREHSSRVEVLAELVPVMRAAATASGPLSEHEISEFAARDLAVGRRCHWPAEGRVMGITIAGELRVIVGDREQLFRDGSLVLGEEP